MLIHYDDLGELELVGECTVNGGFGPINLYRCKLCGKQYDGTDYEEIGEDTHPEWTLFRDGENKGMWQCTDCSALRYYPKPHYCGGTDFEKHYRYPKR
jgi:hypothetical protein